MIANEVPLAPTGIPLRLQRKSAQIYLKGACSKTIVLAPFVLRLGVRQHLLDRILFCRRSCGDRHVARIQDFKTACAVSD